MSIKIEKTNRNLKATYNDHFHVLNFLVAQGANVNAVDKKGSTTLHKAAFNGNLQCVQVLLQKGVNVNTKDLEATTALHNAVYNGHTDVVSSLSQQNQPTISVGGISEYREY